MLLTRLKKLLPFFVLACLLIAWQLAVVNAKNRYLKATVPEVAFELAGHPGDYMREGGVTLGEALLGFLFGNAVAFALAVWMSKSVVAERLVYPYAVALKATPVVALAPLLVSLLGMEYGAKVTAAALVSFFPLVVQLPAALRRVPNELVEMFKAYGASESTVFFRLRLKAASPEIFTALKTSSTLSVSMSRL